MNKDIFIENKIGLKYGNMNFNQALDFPLKLSYLVLMYVKDGNALASINFKTNIIEKGSVLVLSEDDILIISQNSSDFKMKCFLIDRPFASEIAFDLPNHLYSYLHHYPVLKLNELQLKQLELWDQQCDYLLHNITVYQRKMLCNHFQNFFLAISEQIGESDYDLNKKFSRKEELCWKFWDLIGTYAKQHRDVAFYADKLCITPFYLSQITKDFLNYAPKDLINRQVILEIKQLLKTPNKSINDIAQELHFEDPSYMGRYFKRETKQSLTDFRRSL